MRNCHLVTLAIVCVLVSGCASLSSERQSKASTIAAKANLEKITVKTNPFALTAYYRILKPGAPIRVYIEGDGYAWVTPRRVSSDPTPRKPVGLGLASKDLSYNVAYLARPCQYTPKEFNPACREFYWTDGRFSEEVVDSMNQAVSYFVKKAQAPGIDLVGYSGGAAVAVLVAARRTDILSLRTVAGNLDPALVNDYHHVTPFGEGLLDPLDTAPLLVTIPQIHFIGDNDDVIPLAAAESFFKKMGNGNCFQVKTFRGASHQDGWVENWGKLLAWPPKCWDDFDEK